MSPPSSRASFRIRLCPVDVTLAAAAPLAALYLRNVELVSHGNWVIAVSYCLVSLVCSLLAFQALGISNIIPRYISMGDLLRVAEAVVVSQLMAIVAIFSITRLDGIARSVPAIQALLLWSALVAYRITGSLSQRRRHHPGRLQDPVVENVILIGLNDWSVLVLRFLKAQAPERWRIIALLDEEDRWAGRTVNGVQVFGRPAQLEAAIEEFATHGVHTHHVVVGGEAEDLPERELAEVQRACARLNLDLVFMPRPFGLGRARRADGADQRTPAYPTARFAKADVSPSRYLRWKRQFDAVASAILILWLLPLLAIAAAIVLLDIGSPLLFWQQRVGLGGRALQLYKLRTLRPPFDRKGQRIPEEQRLSRIGRLLRLVRIDELPQLLNVLVGDMSLIGPRPLLPQNQPPNAAVRLSVRPGITGWAQVNGGAKLSASEKAALDVWYIRNASLALDLRIIGMTFVSLLRGDRRCERALAQAQTRLIRPAQAGRGERAGSQSVVLLPLAVVAGTDRADSRDPMTTQSP
jgi:lipopolysaccharide/colanic/teichoic acid biosynthesis glycosyltransferase